MSVSIYDLPVLQEWNDALTGAIKALSREEHVAPAIDSVVQVCGYPLATIHRGDFTVLGTPSYDLPGCRGTEHRAFIVVSSKSTIARVPDLRGRNFAVNDRYSNTGMNLPRRLFASVAQGKHFFNEVLLTGSHRESMDAVRSGHADAAAIDCVTFGLYAEFDPDVTAGLRVLTHTDASPSIPFVTSSSTRGETVDALRRALRTFSSHADFAPIRKTLHINHIDVPGSADYDVLLGYQAEAIALGYPDLR